MLILVTSIRLLPLLGEVSASTMLLVTRLGKVLTLMRRVRRRGLVVPLVSVLREVPATGAVSHVALRMLVLELMLLIPLLIGCLNVLQRLRWRSMVGLNMLRIMICLN